MPIASDPSLTPAHRAGSLRGQPGQLRTGEVRIDPQPGERGSPAAPAPLAQLGADAAVRRSCQTMARRGAASVARSQITAVSR